jgi:hypothetical protein
MERWVWSDGLRFAQPILLLVSFFRIKPNEPEIEMNIENLCDQIYRETAVLYQAKYTELGEAAAGYEILYGAPVENPDILFLGYQPGGSKCDAAPGLETGKRLAVPHECVYATADWPLAKQMRKIWSAEKLAECTGLNEIFFRSSREATWKLVPCILRKELEAHSIKFAEAITRCIAPKQIITIGLDTFDRLNDKPPNVLLSRANARLVTKGSIWGFPTYGMMHLSGSQISDNDMERIKGVLPS